MPRFFFDAFDGRSWQRDEFGDDLDLDEVVDHAVALLSDLVRHGLSSRLIRRFEVSVRDPHGRPIYTACLGFQDRLMREMDVAGADEMAIAC